MKLGKQVIFFPHPSDMEARQNGANKNFGFITGIDPSEEGTRVNITIFKHGLMGNTVLRQNIPHQSEAADGEHYYLTRKEVIRQLRKEKYAKRVEAQQQAEPQEEQQNADSGLTGSQAGEVGANSAENNADNGKELNTANGANAESGNKVGAGVPFDENLNNTAGPLDQEKNLANADNTQGSQGNSAADANEANPDANAELVKGQATSNTEGNANSANENADPNADNAAAKVE